MVIRSRFARTKLGSSLAWLLCSVSLTAAATGELRVCAEPDNLPFSNQKSEGFENKIAALLARDLGMKVRFAWHKQRQGYVRGTLGADVCDVIMGVPSGFDRVDTTRAYYRSGYVLVSQSKRHLTVSSWDDPVLRDLKIGLHAIGNDGANSPPAHALGRHKLAGNMVGYSLWSETPEKNPQGKVIDAVASGKIDAAVIWGPFAGYFAKKYGKALTIAPAPADPGLPDQRFAYDIAIGVKKGNDELAAKLDASLDRKQREIQTILTTFNIPRFDPSAGSDASGVSPVVQPNSSKEEH